MLYDSSGLIYTNYHVVRQLDRSRLRAELVDGRTIAARVLAGDDWTDIAVVKIEGDDLPTIPLGDSQSVQPDDWILAIGYTPLLPGIPSVKAGQVASMAGSIQIRDNYPQTGMIEADLFLSPGDSGGPLVNLRGELIGLNAAIRVTRRGRSLTSFSIPLARVQQIAAQLLSPEGLPRPQIGVVIRNMSRGLAAETGHGISYGVFVRSVLANSPAQAAGLPVGSVIVSMDGQSVDNLSVLRQLMMQYAVGDEVEIVVVLPTGEQSVVDGSRQPSSPGLAPRAQGDGADARLGPISREHSV